MHAGIFVALGLVAALVARMRQRLLAQIKQAQRQLRRAKREAWQDPLTGLQNRRRWNELIDSMMRNQRRFSVILFDVANMKSANEIHGHFGADDLLRRVASNLQKRGPDVAVRIGGDEFALILLDTTGANARIVRDRLEEDFGFQELRPGLSTFLTGSCVSWTVGETPEDFLEQMKLADLRLEKRKIRTKARRGEPTTRAEALALVIAERKDS